MPASIGPRHRAKALSSSSRARSRLAARQRFPSRVPFQLEKAKEINLSGLPASRYPLCWRMMASRPVWVSLESPAQIGGIGPHIGYGRSRWAIVP